MSRRGARGNDAHARRTRGRRWHGLCARCAARALLAHPIRAPFLNGPNARVDSLLAPSTAQVYLTKLRVRHLREHGDNLLSPHDPAEPAGAAGGALVELLFTHVQVLSALRLLLLAEDAREALAAAVRMRRRGANALGGRSGSRRTREQPEAPYRRHFFE